jgi:hypothetical protein
MQRLTKGIYASGAIAIVIGIGSVAGLVAEDSKLTNQEKANRIAQEVKSAKLAGYEIAISVEDETASLTGRVSSLAQKKKATIAASHVGGVFSVLNSLIVKSPDDVTKVGLEVPDAPGQLPPRSAFEDVWAGNAIWAKLDGAFRKNEKINVYSLSAAGNSSEDFCAAFTILSKPSERGTVLIDATADEVTVSGRVASPEQVDAVMAAIGQVFKAKPVNRLRKVEVDELDKPKSAKATDKKTE